MGQGKTYKVPGEIEVVRGSVSAETMAILRGEPYPKEPEFVKNDDRSAKGILPSECNRCGMCCKWSIFQIDKSVFSDKNHVDAVERKGITLIMVEGEAFMCVKKPCRYLQYPERSGKFSCSIQHRKPALCRDYHCESDKVLRALRLADK